MSSFVPVHDIHNVEFSANLDRCNYMETTEPMSNAHLPPLPSTTILHFEGSDSLEVKESRDDITSMDKRLNK